MAKGLKADLRETLFNVKEADFIGREYYDEKNPLFVASPSDLIKNLENGIKHESISPLEIKLKEMAGGETKDISGLMHKGYAKTFLFYKGIFVLKRPLLDGDAPIVYPYNIDEKRALCFLLANNYLSESPLFNEEAAGNNALVNNVIQKMIAYLKSKKEKDNNPFADPREVGTNLNYENEKKGIAFLKAYQILKDDMSRKKSNPERFILMLSLSAIYSDITSTFSGEGGKKELKRYGVSGDIQPINPEEDINGELRYWSDSYFHSRFAHEGRFWQMIKKENKALK